MVKINQKDILELENRRKIYNFILKMPGIHLREVSRQLHIPLSTLKYHLNYLERKNLIKFEKVGKHKRYFAQYKIGSMDKEVFKVIRQRISKEIIILTFQVKELNINQLTNSLQSSDSTILHHLKKLEKLGIIGNKREDGRVLYYLKNRKYIYDFFIRFKDSLLDDSFFSAFSLFIKESLQDEKPIFENKYKTNKYFDKLCDVIQEMFSPPFCS